MAAAEIELTAARIAQFEPNFDDISFQALCAIHAWLFQDIYEWAGELRTVDISKAARASRLPAVSPRRRTNSSSSWQRKIIWWAYRVGNSLND